MQQPICRSLFAVLIAAMPLFSTVLAQKSADEGVYLLSRTIASTTDADLLALKNVPDADVVHGHFVRLIQFDHLPMPSEKLALTDMGVQLLDYLPTNAYVAAFSTSFSRSNSIDKLVKMGVKNAFILRGPDKMCLEMLNGIFPDFNQKTVGKYDIFVQIHPFLNHDAAILEFQKRGFTVIGNPNPMTGSLTVRTAKSTIEQVANLPFVRFVDFGIGENIPEDNKGRTNHRSNMLNSDSRNGLKYDGRGFGIAWGDDGSVGPHIDFQGRLINPVPYNASNDLPESMHGDMTAGVGAGAGNLDPTLRSNASGATVISYSINNYPQLSDAVLNQTRYNAYITSSSYAQSACSVYDGSSNSIDNQVFSNPKLLHVFSAGNTGTSICAGINVSGFGNITGGFKAAKNVMAVGNLGLTDVLEASSSRGPVFDGRIKPDICAVGTGMNSTGPNNTTQVPPNVSGTSAACPGIAGVAAQLYQAYKEFNGGQVPESALIKALLMNSADDLGQVGPDFQYGWGRVNAWRAFKILKNNQYQKIRISRQDSIKTIALNVPTGTKQVRVMAYWHDAAAAPNAAKILVNDLDMTAKNEATGVVFKPWRLDTAAQRTFNSLAMPAIRDEDHVNNVEQIFVEDPSVTALKIEIKGTKLPSDVLDFYLVYEFITDSITVTYPNGGEPFVAGESEIIRWDAPLVGGAFDVDVSYDNGVNWQIIRAGTTVTNFTWTVPTTATTGKARVRVTRTGSLATDVSDETFTIMRTVPNLSVIAICPDTTFLRWDTLPNALAYEISRLGEKYMDSIGRTSFNIFPVRIPAADSAWFSVKAILADGGTSRRALAIPKLRQATTCLTTGRDLAAIKPNEPLLTTYYTCQSGTALPLSILVRNLGFATIDSFTASYRIDNGAIFTSPIVRQRLLSSESTAYNFIQKPTLPALGNHILKVWVKTNADERAANDTLNIPFSVVDRFRGAPLSETFESPNFPPMGFNVVPSPNAYNWEKSPRIQGISGITTAAMYNGFDNLERGRKDTLTTWLVDLTGVQKPVLRFDVAYALNILTRRATLAVVSSTDCGRTFMPTAYEKFRTDLSTNGSVLKPNYVPTAPSQWRRDTLDLSAFKDSIVQFAFVVTNDNDNKLYLDNINIANGLNTPTEEGPLSIPMLLASPNPSANGIFELQLKNFDAKSLEIKVFDAIGKLVYSKSVGAVSGDLIEQINLKNQSAGIYFLQVQTERRSYPLRLTRL
jgi:subtilisin family serine protease